MKSLTPSGPTRNRHVSRYVMLPSSMKICAFAPKVARVLPPPKSMYYPSGALSAADDHRSAEKPVIIAVLDGISAVLGPVIIETQHIFETVAAGRRQADLLRELVAVDAAIAVVEDVRGRGINVGQLKRLELAVCGDRRQRMLADVGVDFERAGVEVGVGRPVAVHIAFVDVRTGLFGKACEL